MDLDTTTPPRTISELSAFPVAIPIRISWADMDAFGHINNVIYFRYFEDARIAYFERAGIDMASSAPEGAGPILSHTSCRFRAPVIYPDMLWVGTRVEALGSDRFLMRTVVYSTAQEKIVAQGEAMVVSFDYRSRQKAEVPEAWVAAFTRLQGEAPAALERP